MREIERNCSSPRRVETGARRWQTARDAEAPPLVEAFFAAELLLQVRAYLKIRVIGAGPTGSPQNFKIAHEVVTQPV